MLANPSLHCSGSLGRERGSEDDLETLILYPPQLEVKKINWIHIISQYLKTRRKAWTSWRTEESRSGHRGRKMGTAACGHRDKVELGACGHRQRWRLVWEAERWARGGGGSLRVIAILHSKFLSIIWIFTLYLYITLIQNISFKNPSTLITFFFYNKPTILETDRNSTDMENLQPAKHHPRPQTRDSGVRHYTQGSLVYTNAARQLGEGRDNPHL